jgi:hypothetical protein
MIPEPGSPFREIVLPEDIGSSRTDILAVFDLITFVSSLRN